MHFDCAPGVSVLFARRDSCYFQLVSDVWDELRDARGYIGPNAVIAHPPCRGWGRLSHLAKPRDDEKALGLFAVECVRKFGGVLEHPFASKLWAAAGLPRVGAVDAFGGFTLLLDQGWFGHAAPKPTWVYICAVSASAVPAIPVQLRRAAGRTMALSPADRERTPILFARWLVDLASRVQLLSAGVHLPSPGVQLLSAAQKRAAFSLWQKKEAT